MGRSTASTTLTVLFAAVVILSIGATTSASSSSSTVWDVLEEYGLPRGLLPASVSSYNIRESDRFFTVTLPSPCHVKFADNVYYSTTITGYLNFGSLKKVTGIQAQRFFLKLAVTAVELDYANQQLEFKVGALTQNYPIADFATVKQCQKGPGGLSSCRGVGSFFDRDEVLGLALPTVSQV